MRPAARLLDLTRLVSRLGRGPLTGVDRVELAYLDQFLADGVPLFALVRTALGFVLLDARGARAIQARAKGQAGLGPVDLLGRLTRRHDPLRGQAEADLRRLALARCAVPGLARMLRRHLPGQVDCYNTGHANLTTRTLSAQKALPGARVSVLVHDVIPLDYPEFTRPGIPQVFARKMAAVAAQADRVICTTADARARIAAQFARLGRVPPMVVAPLGVPVPEPGSLPEGMALARPAFLVLGTIEPRKNHALLLDVWEQLARRLAPADMPDLLILGGRGWANAGVFARLDARPPHVVERPGLTDAQVAAVLARAEALLFPSHAEGFGLPLLEAMALGCPVIAADLAVFRELAGDYPVYLGTADVYSWVETIAITVRTAADRAGQGGRGAVVSAIPDWHSHFNIVLTSAS